MSRYRITLTGPTLKAFEAAYATYNPTVMGGSMLKFPGEALDAAYRPGGGWVESLNLLDFRARLTSLGFLVKYVDDQSMLPSGEALQNLTWDLTRLIVPEGKLVGRRKTVAMCALPYHAGLILEDEASPGTHLRNVLLGAHRGFRAVLNIRSGLMSHRPDPSWPNQAGYPTSREEFHIRIGEIITKHFPE